MRILQELGFQPFQRPCLPKDPRKPPRARGHKTRYTTNKRLHEGHVASGA